jgi:hypothetical protein
MPAVGEDSQSGGGDAATATGSVGSGARDGARAGWCGPGRSAGRASRVEASRTAVLVCAVLIAAAGWSSIGTAAAATPAQARPAGPSAELSPLTGGDGVFISSPIPVNLKRAGYVQHEYAASGTATSYTSTGPLGGDGMWSFQPDASAPYRTRVLVRRPADPARFSGTVVIEWLNVSTGVDSDPEWRTTHEEILRRGDVWVGVSAQRIGVMGGPVAIPVPGAGAAGQGLKAIDPERYGSLDHPGDGFAFDIYTQVARALRSGARLGGVRPRRIIAAGVSQSAIALVTYYNGVQPLTHAFDGFFVHSRGAIGLPLVGPGESANLDLNALTSGTPTIFRTDQAAPVLNVQTETDVTPRGLNSYAARQPDSERFRLWEIAGTAHIDAHLLGSTATTLDCGVPINDGPLHVVAKAGLRALTAWVKDGKVPPTAERIEVTPDASPPVQRNADGVTLGGIRTPPVDVPVAAVTAVPPPNPSITCQLAGSTAPFSAERLAQLYPSRAAYLKNKADADAAIKAGFVLANDRAALLAFADPSRIAG